MPRTVLDEGVDYVWTVNTPVDTSGETLTAKLFEKNGSGSWTVGTAAGDSPDTDIDVPLEIDDRAPNDYILEIWVDINNASGVRDLIDPDEGEVNDIEIFPRSEVTN